MRNPVKDPYAGDVLLIDFPHEVKFVRIMRVQIEDQHGFLVPTQVVVCMGATKGGVTAKIARGETRSFSYKEWSAFEVGTCKTLLALAGSKKIDNVDLRQILMSSADYKVTDKPKVFPVVLRGVDEDKLQ